MTKEHVTSRLAAYSWACALLVGTAACASGEPAPAPEQTAEVKEAVCTSPLTLVATPANSGFETDVNNDGVPDGWTRGGTGNTQTIDPGYDGKSVKLSAFSAAANIYIDSPAAVIPTSSCGTPTKLLIRATAQTSGALNLAIVEVNGYANTVGTGPLVGGLVLDLRGSAQYHTFTVQGNFPASAHSVRARVRARGAGTMTVDNLYIAATDGTSGGVHPVLNCVKQVDATHYDALFGYQNDNATELEIPVGPENAFSPLPGGRGQVETFQSGHVDRAFAVRFDGNPLDWSLTGGTVTARATSPACSSTPCASPCANGVQCIDGACVTDCGDSLCAFPETCRSCGSDCACSAGQLCVRDRCGQPARCGIEWKCGSGTSFGVTVDCGSCPSGLTCQGHDCR